MRRREFITRRAALPRFSHFKIAGYRFHRFIFEQPENIPSFASLTGDEKVM
jgi:hypothetical protein